MDELQGEGIAIAIVDALSDEDLGRLGEALRGAPFLTAPARGWATVCRAIGVSAREIRADLLPAPARGLKAILAGSCSAATNSQVQQFIRDGGEAHALEPAHLAVDLERLQIARVLSWADACWRSEAGCCPCLSTRLRSRNM